MDTERLVETWSVPNKVAAPHYRSGLFVRLLASYILVANFTQAEEECRVGSTHSRIFLSPDSNMFLGKPTMFDIRSKELCDLSSLLDVSRAFRGGVLV